MDYDSMVRDRFFQFQSSWEAGLEEIEEISYPLVVSGVIACIIFNLISLISLLINTYGEPWAFNISFITQLLLFWPSYQMIYWLLHHNEESGDTTVDLVFNLLI